MTRILLCLAAVAAIWARDPETAISRRAATDFPMSADPTAPQWKDAPAVFAGNGPRGETVPGYRTEIRSRWTSENVYFLFICPYEELHLKPNPTTGKETNHLWDWDVAEVFVGSNFKEITRYKEFEISPQGEWMDLDIDRVHPLPEGGWLWNSKFAVKARIDAAHKVWYGEMRIPLRSIDQRPPQPGRTMRVNFYRCQGSDPKRKYIAWQPTGEPSFHVPQSFGLLKLEP